MANSLENPRDSPGDVGGMYEKLSVGDAISKIYDSKDDSLAASKIGISSEDEGLDSCCSLAVWPCRDEERWGLLASSVHDTEHGDMGARNGREFFSSCGMKSFPSASVVKRGFIGAFFGVFSCCSLSPTQSKSISPNDPCSNGCSVALLQLEFLHHAPPTCKAGAKKKRSMTFIHEEWICHFHDSKALHAGDVTRRRMECGILFHDRTLKINLAGDAAPLLLLLTLLPLFFRGFKRIMLC